MPKQQIQSCHSAVYVRGNTQKALIYTIKSRFMDTRFVRTPHYYRQFALSLGKESAYVVSKVNPLNMEIP